MVLVLLLLHLLDQELGCSCLIKKCGVLRLVECLLLGLNRLIDYQEGNLFASLRIIGACIGFKVVVLVLTSFAYCCDILGVYRYSLGSRCLS